MVYLNGRRIFPTTFHKEGFSHLPVMASFGWCDFYMVMTGASIGILIHQANQAKTRLRKAGSSTCRGGAVTRRGGRNLILLDSTGRLQC